MSIFIAPAVSAVTGLLNQKGTARAQTLARDLAAAQSSNNLADQSYLMVAARNSTNPPTRYEYDQSVAPYQSAIQSGDIATLRSVGLWTDAYIASVAAQHPQAGITFQTPTAPAPPGSSAQAPAGAGQPGALPSWAIPVGIGAVALLALNMMKGRRKS